MTMQLDRAANALFPSGERSEVGNIKFFRGRRRQVPTEQMAEQLNRADAQIAAGDIQPMDNVDGDLTC